MLVNSVDATASPEVSPVEDFETWLAGVQATPAVKLLLDPFADQRLTDLARPTGEVIVLVGPEGGLADEEIAATQAAGFQPIRLGPRVLRTEVAGLALLAAINALWGDF
jgi:16S rRNA (uracil1498-N3)-methyltransferase